MRLAEVRVMEVRIKVDDGTSWANASDERVDEALWMLHHGDELTTKDRRILSGLLTDYLNLLRNPLGVEHSIRKFRMVSRAMKRVPRRPSDG